MMLSPASMIFSLGGIAITFVAVSLMVVSTERFVKGELKKFLKKFIFGVFFLYLSVIAQFLYDISPSPSLFFDLLKSVSLYLAAVFLFLATNEMYELSKVLGFASGRLPKKIKRILTK